MGKNIPKLRLLNVRILFKLAFFDVNKTIVGRKRMVIWKA
jgi:hypothetical protein